MAPPPPSKLARARALLSAVVAEADESTVSGAALGACIPAGLMKRIRAELATLESARDAAPAELESESFPVAARRLLEWIQVKITPPGEAIGESVEFAKRLAHVLSLWRSSDEIRSDRIEAAETLLRTISADMAVMRGALEKIRETTNASVEQADRFRALLERVRSYAVVDPLGNPGAIPSTRRMHGLELDIDDALREAAAAAML